MENQHQIRWGLVNRETGDVTYSVVVLYENPPDLAPTQAYAQAYLENHKREIILAIIEGLYKLEPIIEPNED